MSTQFLKFLTTPACSIERERLLHLTATHQLKLYAAIHGQRLMITEPELDLEGFDFTISSEFESVHLQSKGTLKQGGSKRWKIRAALLKPSFYNRDLMPNMDGQLLGGFSTGATGGVLLHVIDNDAVKAGRLEITYRYLDVYWLIGVASGAAGLPQKQKTRALQILREMRGSDDEQKITLRISDFASLNSVADIAFLRLNVGGMSNWASSCHSGIDLADIKALDNQDVTFTWPGRSLLA